ncbi:MAG TPA: hypothetical protein VKM35_08320 [Arenimonas sp.]|nr:hypothetical protein [Arenimonas sp.]HMB57202.1 hypothetical protein [Arenimonas sp.]
MNDLEKKFLSALARLIQGDRSGTSEGMLYLPSVQSSLDGKRLMTCPSYDQLEANQICIPMLARRCGLDDSVCDLLSRHAPHVPW